MAFKLLLLASLFAASAMGQIAQVCPTIQCVLYDAYMESNNQYRHPTNIVIQYQYLNLCLYHEAPLISGVVKLRSCGDNPNQICNMLGNDFAWTQASTVNSSMVTSPQQSPLYGKKTQVNCMDRNDLIETNLNNGRQCLEDYQCISRNCNWYTGFCVGRQLNESCYNHSDCDIGLYCGQSLVYPFNTTCQAQLNQSQACRSDYECQNNLGCTRLFNGTSNQCTPYYSLPDNTLFVWNQALYGTLYNQINMTKDAVLYHGKFCMSGLAYRFAQDLASCYSIDKVTLSNDKSGSSQNSPVQCSTTSNTIIFCQYYQAGFGNYSRFNLPCECGYNTNQQGYCPLPDQNFLTKNGLLVQQTLNTSVSYCHTLDRFNLVAQRDCGTPQVAPNNIQQFEDTLDSMLQLNYWSFTRSTDALNCLSGVMPFSSVQVMAHASQLALAILLTASSIVLVMV